MTTVARLRRSVLFMPGSNARALDKARWLNADGIIMDLEDAVAPQQKNAAREQRAQRIVDAWQQASGDGGALVVVDGQLVEHFHVEEAHRVLSIANAIAQVTLDACSS